MLRLTTLAPATALFAALFWAEPFQLTEIQVEYPFARVEWHPTNASLVAVASDFRDRLNQGALVRDVSLYEFEAGAPPRFKHVLRLSAGKVTFHGTNAGLAFAKNGLLAFIEPAGGVSVFEQQGAEWRRLAAIGDVGDVAALAWSPDSKLLAVASESPKTAIHLWSVRQMREVARIPTEEAPTVLRYIGKDRLVCGDDKGGLSLIDAAAGRVLERSGGHDGTIYDCSVSPNGEAIATCGGDGEVRLWKMGPLSSKSIVTREYVVTAVQLLDDERLIWGAADGSLGVVTLGREAPAKELKGKHHVSAFALNSTGVLLVASEASASVSILKVNP